MDTTHDCATTTTATLMKHTTVAAATAAIQSHNRATSQQSNNSSSSRTPSTHSEQVDRRALEKRNGRRISVEQQQQQQKQPTPKRMNIIMSRNKHPLALPIAPKPPPRSIVKEYSISTMMPPPLIAEDGHNGNDAPSDDNDPSDDPNDDFDIMLLHEDFPHLLAIATKAKATRQKIAAAVESDSKSNSGNDSNGNEHGLSHHQGSVLLRQPPPPPPPFLPPPPQPTNAANLAQGALRPDEIMAAVERMQQALVIDTASTEASSSSSSMKKIIPRGRYPITDSIMEDSMLMMQEEHEAGEQWLLQRRQALEGKAPYASCTGTGTAMAMTAQAKRGRDSMESSAAAAAATANHFAFGSARMAHPKTASIVVKYAKWQTDILMNWMIENIEAPFPNQEQIEWLSSQTGLTNIQVVNWTTNVRKRNRKATCVEGKKPHHFIDFLFLVQDRESKALQHQRVLQQQQEEFEQLEQVKSQYGAPMMRKTSLLQRDFVGGLRQQPQSVPSFMAPPPKTSTAMSSLLYNQVNRQPQQYRSTVAANQAYQHGHHRRQDYPMPDAVVSHSQATFPRSTVVHAHGYRADDPVLLDFSYCWLETSDDELPPFDFDEDVPTPRLLEILKEDAMGTGGGGGTGGPVGSGSGRMARTTNDILPAVTYDDSSNKSLAPHEQQKQQLTKPPPLHTRIGSFGFGSLDDDQFNALAMADGFVFE